MEMWILALIGVAGFVTGFIAHQHGRIKELAEENLILRHHLAAVELGGKGRQWWREEGDGQDS